MVILDSNLVTNPAILNEVFVGISLSLQANARAVSQVRSRPLPVTYFQIRCSLITLYKRCNPVSDLQTKSLYLHKYIKTSQPLFKE